MFPESLLSQPFNIADVSLESRCRKTSIVGQNATYRKKPEVLNVNGHFVVSPNISDTSFRFIACWHNNYDGNNAELSGSGASAMHSS